MDIVNEHYAGEICPKTGMYGQYSDSTGVYAGQQYDKYVEKGKRFQPSLNNHNFQQQSGGSVTWGLKTPFSPKIAPTNRTSPKR
jgi:hypothetical protein